MKWLTIFFAILLTAFLVFHFHNKQKHQQTSIRTLGQVLSLKGQVMVKNTDQEVFEDLKLNSPLTHSQKIITGLKSQVLIEFGDRFLLKPESSILLLKLGSQYQVHLLSGQIQKRSKDKNTQFLVNNRVVKEDQIQAPKTKLQNLQQEQQSQTSFPVPEKTQSPQNSKLQTLLTKTFLLHYRFMQKCFIKHYERKKGNTQSGQVLLSFYLQENGSLSEITIKKSHYKDHKLHLCLQEVASRLRFSYKGTKDPCGLSSAVSTS